MAAMINAANKMYADQKAAEEAARAAAANAEIQKKEDLQEILDMFADWLNEYYGIEESLPADQVLGLIDSVKEYVEAIKNLETMFSKKPAAPIGAKIIKNGTKPNADETITAFLNKMGW